MQPDIASNPKVQALIAATTQVVAEAEAFKVTTAEQYTEAGELLKRVKSRAKELEEEELKITRPINAGLKAVRDLFRTPRQRAASAESVLKRAMIAFTAEQDRKRRELQAQQEEAARREREKLARQAERAAAKGKVERAAELEQRAATVVAPVVQIEQPKVAGISDRKVWKAECTDLKALVKAIAEGRAPLSYVMANDKVLGQQARSLKSEFVCDGVRVWSESSLAAGAQ